MSYLKYDVVVDVLKWRFDNLQLIIDAHYHSLSHLPAATNQIGKLRKCYDTVECHLFSLKALGENYKHRHFVALITDKLAQKVLYQLYMMKGEEAWTVAILRELLGKHITTIEMAGGEFHSQSQPPPTKSIPKSVYHYKGSRNRHQGSQSTAGELFSAGNSSSEGRTMSQKGVKCIFCSQNHWSDECPSIPHKMLERRN